MTTTTTLQPSTVKIGDGVTEIMWSDRHAGTVTYVSPSGKTIRFTRDTATPNGPIHDREQYDYSYESNPERTWETPMGTQTNAQTARWSDKRQAFVTNGRRLIAGRHEYYDPTF